MTSLADFYRAIRRYDMDKVSPREAADLAWTNWHEQSDDYWEEGEDDGHASEPLTLPVDEVLNQDPRVLFGNERLLLSDVYTDDPFCTGRRDPRRLLMS